MSDIKPTSMQGALSGVTGGTADILIDGQLVGKSVGSAVVTNLPLGTHTVEMKSPHSAVATVSTFFGTGIHMTTAAYITVCPIEKEIFVETYMKASDLSKFTPVRKMYETANKLFPSLKTDIRISSNRDSVYHGWVVARIRFGVAWKDDQVKRVFGEDGILTLSGYEFLLKK